MRPRRVRRTARRASLVVAAAVGLGLLAQGAASAQEQGPDDEKKIELCHATKAAENPYNLIDVSRNAVFNKGTENGHAHHDDEGIFAPGAETWGDIIPPFEHDGGSFPGLNWPEGQAIFENGCELPEPVIPDEVDLCPNLEDVQDEVPPGLEVDEDGNCVAIVVDVRDGGADKVTLCHATAATVNPYEVVTVSQNAVWNNGEPNGHGTHTGPIYEPGVTDTWGDIIPPFSYEVVRGGETITESFPGMNWPEGQAIFENDCEFPAPVEPTDVCPNLPGDQEAPPEGYEIVDGECVLIEVAPTDLCPNLEGDQTEVPEGYEIVDGECVVETVVEEVVIEQPVVVVEEVIVEREVIVAQPTTPTIVAGVGGDDTEVLGVVQTAGPAASAGQLAVTGPATVPLLVLFGLLNLLFGARLRRYSARRHTTS